MKLRLRKENLHKRGKSKKMITLRSGKEVDLPTPKLEQEPDTKAEKEKMEENKERRKKAVQRRRTLKLS